MASWYDNNENKLIIVLFRSLDISRVYCLLTGQMELEQ